MVQNSDQLEAERAALAEEANALEDTAAADPGSEGDVDQSQDFEPEDHADDVDGPTGSDTES